jgi:hypothetical protein
LCGLIRLFGAAPDEEQEEWPSDGHRDETHQPNGTGHQRMVQFQRQRACSEENGYGEGDPIGDDTEQGEHLEMSQPQGGAECPDDWDEPGDRQRLGVAGDVRTEDEVHDK